jgi:hypothetical protein
MQVLDCQEATGKWSNVGATIADAEITQLSGQKRQTSALSADVAEFIEAEFKRLVQRWHQERGATSSITAMAICPAYQEIIALGPPAIPLILRQLESEGDEPQMWFWALKVLTRGFDPVPDSARGDFRAMARAWLNWERGLMAYGW